MAARAVAGLERAAAAGAGASDGFFAAQPGGHHPHHQHHGGDASQNVSRPSSGGHEHDASGSLATHSNHQAISLAVHEESSAVADDAIDSIKAPTESAENATRGGPDPGGTQPQRSNTRGSQSPKDLPLFYQSEILMVYDGFVCQVTVAVIICVNFVVSALEAQVAVIGTDPDVCGSMASLEIFEILDWIFNILFSVELLVNMYAHFFWVFWSSAWNYFDVFVVTVSWMSAVGSVPGISVLRLLRAFRAFRLFNRIESVKVIIIGVARSLPGVSNAFMLLTIVMGIWSIIGVEFFREDFEEFFGNFMQAMLTVFQIATFDSWVNQIARPVCLFYESWFPPVYFISYFFVNGIILMNVVVAILLDKFMAASAELEQAEQERQAEQKAELEDATPTSGGQAGQTPSHIAALKNLDGEADAPPEQHIEVGDAFLEILEEEFARQLDTIELKCHTLVGTKPKGCSAGNGEAPVELQPRTTQELLKAYYETPMSQIGIAILIGLNFVISSVQAQIDPQRENSGVFDFIEKVLNTIFLIELLVNMAANWFWAFWCDAWNLFDFLIVVISWVSMLGSSSGIITVLRLFRAFRVFRLFRRIESLRLIIIGIIHSLPGVSNAFVIMFLVMGIWSIMGVNFFRCQFPDEYGNFTLAMLTMFQIMSYDSWSSGLTRPIVNHYQNSIPETIGTPIYFLTYLFISAIIMLNVVLTILLDKFLGAARQLEAQDEEAEASADLDAAADAAEELQRLWSQSGGAIEVSLEEVHAFEERLSAKLQKLKETALDSASKIQDLVAEAEAAEAVDPAFLDRFRWLWALPERK